MAEKRRMKFLAEMPELFPEPSNIFLDHPGHWIQVLRLLCIIAMFVGLPEMHGVQCIEEN
jgi:hypothetical protein